MGILSASQKQASRATAPWWPLLFTQPSLLAGAHPHGLLLQDQKIPALPGGKQAGPLHAPGAEREPDHGGGKELAQVPGKAAVSFEPSPLLTEDLVGAQSC